MKSIKLHGPGIYKVKVDQESEIMDYYNSQVISPGGAAQEMGVTRQSIDTWAQNRKIYMFKVYKNAEAVNVSRVWVPLISLATAELGKQYKEKQAKILQCLEVMEEQVKN